MCMQYITTYFIYTGDSVTYSDICIHVYTYCDGCRKLWHTLSYSDTFSVIYITQNHILASSTDSKFFITLWHFLLSTYEKMTGAFAYEIETCLPIVSGLIPSIPLSIIADIDMIFSLHKIYIYIYFFLIFCIYFV